MSLREPEFAHSEIWVSWTLYFSSGLIFKYEVPAHCPSLSKDATVVLCLALCPLNMFSAAFASFKESSPTSSPGPIQLQSEPWPFWENRHGGSHLLMENMQRDPGKFKSVEPAFPAISE